MYWENLIFFFFKILKICIFTDRGIYFAKYYGGGGGMASGEKNENWGCGKKIKKKGKGGKGEKGLKTA